MLRLLTVIAAVLLPLIAGCGPQTDYPSYPGVVLEVRPESLEIAVGQTAEIVATVLNEQDQRVTFRSNHPAVATVTSGGEVRAMAPGEAVIEVQSIARPTLKTLTIVTVVDE